MTPTLKTDRLILRPLVASDAPELTTHLGNWDVIKWLSAPPWPYTIDDANWFIAQEYPEHWAIVKNEALIGVVAFDPTLGYWLAADAHGHGIMSEAVMAVLKWHFEKSNDPVISGHKLGNDASRAVLLKHGFLDTHIELLFSRPLGKETDTQLMELTADRWHSLRNAKQ